jgi:hypothetical protein
MAEKFAIYWPISDLIFKMQQIAFQPILFLNFQKALKYKTPRTFLLHFLKKIHGSGNPISIIISKNLEKKNSKLSAHANKG